MPSPSTANGRAGDRNQPGRLPHGSGLLESRPPRRAAGSLPQGHRQTTGYSQKHSQEVYRLAGSTRCNGHRQSDSQAALPISGTTQFRRTFSLYIDSDFAHFYIGANSIKTRQDEGKKTALTVAWRLCGTDEQKNLVRSAASDLDIDLPPVLRQPHVTFNLSVIQPWDHLHKRLADLAAQVRLRERFEDFDDKWNKMLREATGTALTDLEKQIQRQVDLEGKHLLSSS